MRLEQGYRFDSLQDVSKAIVLAGPHEPIEMDRIQYAAYKELVWKWLRELNPISVFEEHTIVVIKRSDEALSTGASELANNVI